MANEYAVNQADLQAVADAIRTKGGTSDALTFPDGFVNAVGKIQAGGGGSEGEVVTVTGWARPSEWPAQPKGWKDEACVYLLIDCTGELAYLHLQAFSGNAYIGTTTADGTFVADSDEPIALVNGRVYLKDEDFGNRDYCWIKIVPSDGVTLSIAYYPYADAYGMNGRYSTTIEHLTANVKNSMTTMYMEQYSIVHVHAFNCTISNIDNVAYYACKLKKFNLENCTVENGAARSFNNCALLEELLFDGTTVTASSAQALFLSCYSLREIDLSGWTFTGADVSIFQGNMYALKKMNLNGFKTTGTLTTNQIVASYARSLESIDLSHYASAPITKITLDRLTSIRELSFPPNNWALTSFNLRECCNLERLDVSNLDLTGVTNLSGSATFWTLSKLQHCSAINAKVSIQFNGSPLLTHESLMNIINGLPTVETTQTLTVGSVNTAKLTEDEIAIATAKGWTVA